MTYSYDASVDTNLNRLRNLLADTDSTNYLFSNEELNLFITMGGDVYEAASLACLAIANNRSLSAIFFSIHNEDVRIDRKQIPEYFLKLSDRYHTRATELNVVEYFDSIDYDISKYGVESGEFSGDDELF